MSDSLIEIAPDHEPRGQMLLDLVFVHGLGGHQETSWGEHEGFWPAWLAAEFPTCRILMAGYDTNLFASALAGGGASIPDLGTILADELRSRDNPAQHIVLIAHSLGGLVVKQMLRTCSDSANTRMQELGRSVIGVVFLGTPHQGAQLAKALDILLRQLKSKQSKELAYAADALIELNNFFRSYSDRQSLLVRSYYETEKTWGVQIVDKVTANPGVLGSDAIAVQADHLGICKPDNQSSKLYKSIKDFIREALERADVSSSEAPTIDRVQLEGEIEIARAAFPPAIIEGAEEQSPDCEALADYEFFTAVAEDDRRNLATKLEASGRSYLVESAERKKERFYMALHRRIAQRSAVMRYTKLMADIESRFDRHVRGMIAAGADVMAVESAVQEYVITPCAAAHSTKDEEITAHLVDGALYYLAGNCHVAWDND